jgi:hypothetical protein
MPVIGSVTRAAMAMLVVLAVGACEPQAADPPQAPATESTHTSSRPGPPKPDKVLVIVYENKGPSQIPKGAPGLLRLSQRYGVAAHYSAITHPSEPNYLAIAFGSTMGVTDDKFHGLKGPTIFGGTVDAGMTAMSYMESMGSENCRKDDHGDYRRRHNPHVLADDERDLCRAINVNAKAFKDDVDAGRLPNVGLFSPNLCNDAHSCKLRTFDKWLDGTFARITDGPDWKSGRLVVIVTADEDNREEGNRVFTAVLNPSLRGRVVETPLNHFGLSRSLARYGHTSPLRDARTATDVLAQFGL